MSNYDLIIFGATGATGGQTISYVDRHAKDAGIKWAIAGRSREKLEKVASTFSAKPDGIVIADALDSTAVDTMVRQTKAVINLAGPYALYGENVIAACAKYGVSYADLAGETLFVKSMIEKYGKMAEDSNARIIPTSGYEALPFDIGCFLAVDRFEQAFGKKPSTVQAVGNFQFSGKYFLPSDGVSGGTWGSGVEMMKADDVSGIDDPHILLDGDGDWLPDESKSYSLLRNIKTSQHGLLSPMLPSPWLNPAVIYRSQEILRTNKTKTEGSKTDNTEKESSKKESTQGFHYKEGMDTSGLFPGDKLLKPAVALGAAATMQAAEAMLKLPIAAPRKLVGKIMEVIGPAPGDGPKPDRLDLWSYSITFHATDDDDNEKTAAVIGVGQPGYKSTADMIGQVGLLLGAEDKRLPQRAGFLTPYTGLGLDVIEEFSKARLIFE